MKLPMRRARHPGLSAIVGTVGPDVAVSRRGIIGRVRAIRRGVSIAVATLPCLLIQTVMLAIPGRGRIVFARMYWAMLCRLIGLRVRVIGQASVTGRPVVFASNHSSWLDVLVLGGRLDACFVAKAEVGTWPVVSLIARLGRTVYVSRRATRTGHERDDMHRRLADGDNLILFPEGTSSDGSRVLPFRSAFFAIADGTARPLIQPVSVVYDQLAGLPIGRASRPVFAWYGDMALGSHFWRLAQLRGLRATVLLHQPIDPARYASRKELSAAVYAVVADGAAMLRQNRPAMPIGQPSAQSANPAGMTPAAFA